MFVIFSNAHLRTSYHSCRRYIPLGAATARYKDLHCASPIALYHPVQQVPRDSVHKHILLLQKLLPEYAAAATKLKEEEKNGGAKVILAKVRPGEVVAAAPHNPQKHSDSALPDKIT